MTRFRARYGLTIVVALSALIPGIVATTRDSPQVTPAASSHSLGGRGGPPAPLTLAPPSVSGALDPGAAQGVAPPPPGERAPWAGFQAISGSPGLAEVATRHPAPAMNAAGGILVDADTGGILWQQNAHAALPPASTTKILTALVALRNFEPQQLVTVTPDALNEEWDETLMGLANGEKLTVEELLYGALLVSGNDAAKALAAGTVGMDSFVAGMNAQVRALGLQDSHFVSPVGLDDPGQRASAFDLAVLARTAVRSFPLFRSIVASSATTLPATPTHHPFTLYNLNELLRNYPGAIGIKPGWTGAAGSCLVGMASRGGHTLISVVLNAPRPTTQTGHLLDWGFGELSGAADSTR